MGGKEDTVPRRRMGDRALPVTFPYGVCGPRRPSRRQQRAPRAAVRAALAVSGRRLTSVTSHKVDCPAWWRPPEVSEGRSPRQ